MKKKVFVSFDYENDMKYKYLLEAWNENPDFDFVFDDRTPEEIQTDSVDRVKAVLTAKIRDSTYVLALIGKYANELHEDREEIGEINWINWELKKGMEEEKLISGVTLEHGNELPIAIEYKNLPIEEGFSLENVKNALNRAKTL